MRIRGFGEADRGLYLLIHEAYPEKTFPSGGGPLADIGDTSFEESSVLGRQASSGLNCNITV